MPALLAACLSACGAPPTPYFERFPSELGAFSSRNGPAIITEGEFDAQSEARPWSGYWYPLSRIDARSAFEKYDRLTGRASLAQEVRRLASEGRPFQP